MSADFVVVGGGIGGTVLAELLGRGGKKVVVLEKSTGPPNWIRPEVLWPATVDVLVSLTPSETWEKEAVLPHVVMQPPHSMWQQPPQSSL